VNPSNAKYITQAALSAFKADGLELVKSKAAVDARKDEPTERTQYSNDSGKPFVESWRITEGPHAWSGGNVKGSYTDPDGPDASAAMLAFFLKHRKAR
jgi:poly(3-hydroxybutyrate) depolymerase